jgi:O-antigen/teichoic acid export membrane protein
MTKSTAKGLLYIMISRIFWIISAFAIHVGLGRLLGPELYGVFGVIFSMISINYLVLGNGVKQAVTKYVAEDVNLAGAIKTAGLKIQTFFSVMIGATVFLLSKPIAILLGDDTLSNLIKLSALIIPPTAILFVHLGVLHGLKQFDKSATISIMYAFLKVVFVFLLVLSGLKVYGAIIGLILSVILATFVAAFLCPQSTEGHFDSSVLIRFAIPVSLFYIAIALLMHMDILFAKSLLADDAKIGFYTSAQTLSRTMYLVFAAFSVVLLPSISSANSSNNRELIKKYLNQSMRYMLMLLIPTAFIISATSDQLLNLVYSSTYFEAAYPLSILVFGVSFLSISLALSTIMQGYGTPNIPLVIFSILVPLNACLLLVMVPRFELLGAALSTTLTSFTGLLILCSLIYKEFKLLAVGIRSLLKIISASLITYFIAFQFSFSGFLLPIYYFGLFALYFFILFIFKEISDDDISFATSIFSRARKDRKQPEVLTQEL